MQPCSYYIHQQGPPRPWGTASWWPRSQVPFLHLALLHSCISVCLSVHLPRLQAEPCCRPSLPPSPGATLPDWQGLAESGGWGEIPPWSSES